MGVRAGGSRRTQTILLTSLAEYLVVVLTVPDMALEV